MEMKLFLICLRNHTLAGITSILKQNSGVNEAIIRYPFLVGK